MSEILDQATDRNGQAVYQILQLYNAPAFVKQASPARLGGGRELPNDCYGLPGKLAFPCHTGPATWLSLAYLLTQKQALDNDTKTYVAGRLYRAGAYHGITGDLDNLKAAVLASHTVDDSQLHDDAYGLVEGDGPERQRHYRLANAAEVKAAAAYLQAHRPEFAYEQRRQLASRILTKAAAHQVTLDEPSRSFLERQAGHGVCSARTVAEELVKRAQALRTLRCALPTQEGLVKLARAAVQAPRQARTAAWRVKVAGVLDGIDRQYALHHVYPPAEDALFALAAEKIASFRAEHVSTPTGKTYRVDDLARLPAAQVKAALGAAADGLGDGLYLNAVKLAAAVPGLPWDASALLEDVAALQGVEPVVKRAQPAQAWSEQALQELAALPV